MKTLFTYLFATRHPFALNSDVIGGFQGPAVEDDYTAVWYIVGGIVVIYLLIVFIVNRKSKDE